MRYAIIDESGYVTGISDLSGEVHRDYMISVDENFDPTNKKWNGTSWESYTPPEPPEPEPTMEEKIYAAVSKSQDEIRQEGVDMVMEEMKKRGLIV